MKLKEIGAVGRLTAFVAAGGDRCHRELPPVREGR